jgi:hypothetical protein
MRRRDKARQTARKVSTNQKIEPIKTTLKKICVIKIDELKGSL